MLHAMMDALFGCGHHRTTFPISPRRKYAGAPPISASRSDTYVACLDCGKEFTYDWKTMRIGEQKPSAPPTPAVQQTQPSYQ